MPGDLRKSGPNELRRSRERPARMKFETLLSAALAERAAWFSELFDPSAAADDDYLLLSVLR